MWIILAIVILVVLLLTGTSFEIRDEIEINAPTEKVWAAIIDFEHYKEWNSQLSFLGGTVQPKGKLHLKLSAAGAKPYEFKPDISYWQKNEQFAWIAKTGLPRIFDGEHFFELKDLGNGKTRVINREEYRGVLSQLFKQLPMMKTAPDGFRKMNQELKDYVEHKNQQ
ncbi:MAG: SRPBCC domain-containing protein [Bacteroidetes bacterium]|nr:MAG: SRPBCC domain-containing protein [Bacteroidota bacterium]